MRYRTTTTTGMVGGRYSGTMETVAVGRDMANIQVKNGWKRTAKGGIKDGMAEI